MVMKFIRRFAELVGNMEKDQWVAEFCAEYQRRVGITIEDAGSSSEEIAERYWPGFTPLEAVLHQIDKYDLMDITEGGW